MTTNSKRARSGASPQAVIRFKLNGEAKRYRGDPEVSLLRVLRDELGVTTVKEGCAPQGSCGACTVQVDGRAALSCVLPMSRVAGAKVVTPEGLGAFAARAFADAFVRKGGIQCGYCTPGIVMRADALIKRSPHPSRDDICRMLTPHLCRCTGYKKILDSIEAAAEAIQTRTPVPAEGRTGKAGTSLPKHDMRAAVLGQRPFVADIHLPGMRHGALKLSDHPRARVLRIDPAPALALEGVERVILAHDVPGERSVGLIVSDWPVLVAQGETTRYVGDVLAVVVARSRAAARKAAGLVAVDYEVLEPVLDPDAALRPEAPRLHEPGNVLETAAARRGDMDAAFKSCAFVVEQVYTTQTVEHAFLEPEACLAVPLKDGLTVYSASQGVYEDRRQLSRLLSLPEERLRVVQVPSGGAFGGKEDLSVQGQTALAAWLLKKPVRIQLSRDESIHIHPKRHPFRMAYKLGASKDGRLLALHARMTADTGAYASVGGKVMERACDHAAGAYFVPNVDIAAAAVYTNNIPCGAMRGFGANQATFAMESAVDEMCALGGFDRWQFRWDNALAPGRATVTGQVLGADVGVRACLEAVKGAFRGARYAGLACGLKNCGMGNGINDVGACLVKVVSPDKVEVCHGWTEMGQGIHTMAVQVFCQETGLPPAVVAVRTDTADGTCCGMTTSSRATSLLGNSLIDACRGLKADLKAGGLKALVGHSYAGRWVCDWTTPHAGPEPGRPVCTHYSYSYAAQVCIVSGKGEVLEVVAAHDAGRIMNPLLFEGQIEGSVHMGLGYALTEELELSGGRPKSTNLRDLGILRAKDTPKITVIGVEVPDERGPYGAKGVGEIGLVPTAGAVANALWSVDMVRRRGLPMRRRKTG